MNTSGWQRREKRRDLPPAIRQRNIAVLNHLGIAGMIASRQNLRVPEERDDLEQEARVGVIRGCERFDPQRAVRPSTFLSTAASGQVLHFRRDRANTIRVPWRLRDTYVKGLKLQQQQLQTGKPPLSDVELANALNITVQRWQEACRCHRLMRTGELPDNDTLQGSSQPKDPQRIWLLQALQRLQPNDRELLERHLLEGHSLKRLANDDAMTCRQLGRRIKHLVEELKQWAHQDGLLTLKAV